MAKATLDKVGLILIGHGSRLPHNQENLEKLAEILRKQSEFKIVEIAFMSMNTPTIPHYNYFVAFKVSRIGIKLGEAASTIIAF